MQVNKEEEHGAGYCIILSFPFKWSSLKIACMTSQVSAVSTASDW